MIDIKILVDDKTIIQPRHLGLRKTVNPEADSFDFEIENTRDRYTDIFYQTTGERTAIELQGILQFKGLCDSCEFHYFPESIIFAQGRDYTGLLIDEIITPTLSAKFSGKTASQIVETIAKQYGFKYDITRTTKTGFDEHLYSPGTPVWSAVAELAQKHNFDAYITKEGILIFKERKLSTEVKRVFSFDKKFGTVPTFLHFAQDKTDSLALKLEVIGYDPKAKKRISYLAESPLRNRDNYKILTETRLDLITKSDLRLYAEARLKQYSKDLVTGHLLIPGDPELEPSDCIEFKEMKMSNRYYITEVIHNVSVNGFTTELDFASKEFTEARTQELEFLKPQKPFSFP